MNPKYSADFDYVQIQNPVNWQLNTILPEAQAVPCPELSNLTEKIYIFKCKHMCKKYTSKTQVSNQ